MLDTPEQPHFRFIVGDMVFARETLLNDDGGVPDVALGAVLASAHTRGVIVRVGHLEADPRQTLYVVRFEDHEGVLGPPVGCLPEELTQEAG
jgi:nitrogen fixation protein NifZ